MPGIVRREHEHRLGQVEFARDGLHRIAAQTVAVQHDRERIAGKTLAGEYVEGVETARSAKRLAAKHGVSMPICEAVYKILFKKENARHLIDALWKGSERRELD